MLKGCNMHFIASLLRRGRRGINLAGKFFMPEQPIVERTRQDAREGKSPSTQAGEFVREEFHYIREGKRGARLNKPSPSACPKHAGRA